MTAPLLAVVDLTVRRGGRPVLEDVSFEVGRGDLLAVIGPNGAGKSTLIAAVLGLLPASGRVAVAGLPSYVPQREPDARAFPVTALDVALMGAYPRLRPWRRTGGAERAAARAALARVGLDGQSDTPFSELSGGQRRRVLLARALVHGGDVLLLDEPLAGVDAASEQAILATLDEERARGHGIVLATHDLALARQRCDRVLLLNRRVYGFGPADAVLAAPALRAAYGARLLVLDADTEQSAIDEGAHCADEAHGPAEEPDRPSVR